MTQQPKKFFSWRAAILDSPLPAITKHILLTLACHMNDAGDSCYPSVALLCRETSLSKPTVIAHLKVAEQHGWIIVSKHGFSGQRWSRHSYVISWPEDGDRSSFPDAQESEGGKSGLPPSEEKAVKLTNEGGKADSMKAVNQLYRSTSVNSTGVLQGEKSPDETDVFPPGLDVRAWRSWVEYRKKIRRPLKPVSVPAAQRKLAAFGSDQMAIVEQSVANGWQGLFPLKDRNAYRSHGRKTFADYHQPLTECEASHERASSVLPAKRVE